MKIYVNEIPTEPKRCLFASKEKHSNVFKINADTTLEKEKLFICIIAM